ncbi:MAG: hypothetical protein AAF664_23520, partial [Planctomycetota bacterium]
RTLMNSRTQTALLIGLCGVICMGHMPSWIHVLQAHSVPQRIAGAGERLSHAACRCHHWSLSPTRFEIDSSGNSPVDSPTDDNHDSESCALCHHLFAANGVAWPLAETNSPQTLSELLALLDFVRPNESGQIRRFSRGPPQQIL